MSAPCYDFKLKRVPSGNPYRPDRHDPCKICHCSNGTSLFCTTVMCSPPPNCTNFIQRLDECCSFDCKLTSEKPRIKLIRFETDSVKQGARFGATALTVSLIISIFIFMIMRLKRRQAFINSLSQRSTIPRDNLLWFSDNNNNNLDNFDDLSNLRHIIINSRGCDLPRSLPSTSDFSHHFLPISSFCLPSSEASTISGDRRRLHDPEDLSYVSPPNDSDNLASFTLYGLDLPAYEKGEDEPPPYEAPPPYMEECTNGEEVAQAQLIESYTSSRSESIDENSRATLAQTSSVDAEMNNMVEGGNTYFRPGCSLQLEVESAELKNPNSSA